MGKLETISVIIPVYNVEDYLITCLNSVINQTYQQLDIILVNDGSTDSSPQICKNYSENDSRIKLINKENGGLSDARNFGIKQAKGKFIVFVDSDDAIHKDMINTLYQTINKTDADVVECDYIKFTNLNEISNVNEHINISKEYSSIEAIKSLMEGNLKQVVWNKIYKTAVISNHFFEKGRINEDEFWTYKIFGNANKVVKIQNKLYFYRQQNQSIMGQTYNLRRLDGLIALEERIAYVNKEFPQLVNLAIKTFYFASIYHYQKIVINSQIDPKRVAIDNIIYNLKKNFNIKFIYHLSLKNKIWILSFLLMPRITANFRNKLKIGI